MLHKNNLLRIASLCLLLQLQIGCSGLPFRSDRNGETAEKHGSGADSPRGSESERPPMPGWGPSEPPSPLTTIPGLSREESPRVDSPTGGNAPAAPTPLVPTLKVPHVPRIGIILGPGGARTYAHIGFLRQLQKHRWNIQGIVGIEMAAPIAALYAHKEQINEVEWQYFKIKEDEILGSKQYKGKAVAMNSFAEQLKNIFQNLQTRDLKIPFGCPALNLNTGKDFLMSRGTVSNLVELCTPYPPLFLPYKQNVSGIRELKSAADFLRKQGANFIILVNVISDKNRRDFFRSKNESMEHVVWNELALKFSRSGFGIDATINMDLGNTDISDFSNKKSLIQAGEKACERDIESLSSRLGF